MNEPTQPQNDDTGFEMYEPESIDISEFPVLEFDPLNVSEFPIMEFDNWPDSVHQNPQPQQ